MTYTCIALDLDHTLVDLTGGKESFFTFFDSQGIPSNIAESTYKNIRVHSGFSLPLFLREIEQRHPDLTYHENIAENFAQWLQEYLLIFPEIQEFLNQNTAPIAIVTFGEPDYQHQKLEVAKIPSNHIFVTNQADTKFGPLRELLDLYEGPIAFVDDRPSELNAIYAAGIEKNAVHTFLIDRNKHHKTSDHPDHKIITSLLEILEEN